MLANDHMGVTQVYWAKLNLKDGWRLITGDAREEARSRGFAIESDAPSDQALITLMWAGSKGSDFGDDGRYASLCGEAWRHRLGRGRRAGEAA